MTTPPWAPVSQDVLEQAAHPHLDVVLHGDTSYAVASELLAARALLFALVEALDRLRATSGRDLYDAAGIYYHATQAIEAHVLRHRTER